MQRISFIYFFIFTALSSQVFAQLKPFSFVALGDMPYFLPVDYARFEDVIKEVNQQNQVFSVFVGDIKSSSTPCSQEAYNKMLNYFSQFKKPLIYTPGDNEWTDCGKKEAGGFVPEERLDVLRSTFYKDKLKSFGIEKMPLISQGSNPEYAKFVENTRWENQNIAFATIHIVGTNNNFTPESKNNNAEFFERDKADLAWLEETFQNAKAKNIAGLVIFEHADMFNPDKDAGDANAFKHFLKKLKELTIDFKKPVLLVNGDSHVFLVDKPMFSNVKDKKCIDNFTRLQVPGESNMHAVKVTVDPESKSLFQIEQLMVEGN
jgi:hypothetical protein